jgi:hypothetical protein
MRKANHAVWDEAGSFWPLGGSECSRLPFRDANRHLTPHNLGKRPPDPTNRVHVDPKQINGTGRMNRTQLRCIAELIFISVDVAGRKAHSFQCCFYCETDAPTISTTSRRGEIPCVMNLLRVLRLSWLYAHHQQH